MGYHLSALTTSLCVSLWVGAHASSWAQTEAGSRVAEATTAQAALPESSLCKVNEPHQVLAYLGERPVTRAEIDFALGRSRRSDLPPLSFAAEQAAIELVAKQRQALQTLRELKLAADREQVCSWLESRASDPTANTAEKIIEQMAEIYAVDERVCWEQITFRISWKRYLSMHLTETNLAKHFQNQRRRFDGSRFKIVLISAVVTAGSSPARSRAAEQLVAARSLLAKDPIEWEAVEQLASEKHWLISRGRWIEGSGSLDPAAIDGLLALMPGDVTQPVHTASGVHLIRLLELQSGSRDFEQVKAEIRAHLLIYLLDYLASQSEQKLPLKAKPSV